MNDKFNKNFYRCLKESSLLLDLRYRYMSKKAVRLGSFIQCSVHIFLGHDSCFKDHFKNFVEPYHEELSSKA